MTIALFATGDELIDGNTLNTNHKNLADIMSSEGLPVGLHLSVRDDEAQIVDCLAFLVRDHQSIIITGGLGPTSDDLTRFALAKFLDVPLIEYPEALAHTKERLTRAQLTMNDGNRQQALFPKNAILIPNKNGTALGCFYTHNQKQFFLLPGPPRECLPMFQEYVLPVLHGQEGSDQIMLKWRLFGVPESQIAERMEDALKNIPCQLGYRLEIPYVEFKVRTTQPWVETVKAIVDPLAEPHVIAPNQLRASAYLKQTISQTKQSISIIDEATGGHLESLLLEPANHEQLSFNSTKNHSIQCHITGLRDYWLSVQSPGHTKIYIDYCVNGVKNREEHDIRFFNPQVILAFASEWLCHRLSIIIAQYHAEPNDKK